MKKDRVSISSIAKEMGKSYSLVCKILNNDPKFKPSKSTRTAVIRKAQEMGFNYSSLRRIHRRTHKRSRVEMNAEIVIKRDHDNEVYDSGTVVIKDISPKGAHVSDISLEGGSLPACPFHCELNVTDGELKGFQLKAKPVRMETHNRFVLGMMFMDLKHDKVKLLSNFINGLTS